MNNCASHNLKEYRTIEVGKIGSMLRLMKIFIELLQITHFHLLLLKLDVSIGEFVGSVQTLALLEVIQAYNVAPPSSAESRDLNLT